VVDGCPFREENIVRERERGGEITNGKGAPDPPFLKILDPPLGLHKTDTPTIQYTLNFYIQQNHVCVLAFDSSIFTVNSTNFKIKLLKHSYRFF